MELHKSIGISASEARLGRLIEDRLSPGADKTAIDQRVWDLFGERWAIMFTDLSGFSRNVARFGIVHFLQIIYESERLLIPIIEDHDGIVLKVEGDSFLVIFRNPTKAVSAAVEMQRLLRGYNTDRDPEEQVLLCVGLGFGDVLRIAEHDLFGAGVNAASKLGEDTAQPWEILVTDAMLETALAADGVTGAQQLEEAPPGAGSAHRLQYF